MTTLPALVAAIGSLEQLPQQGSVRGLADAELLELSRTASRVRQLAEAHIAVIAGEIQRRSARELGTAGMAQRLGLRTAEELVRVTNGSTARDASLAVRVGRLVDEPQRWLGAVSRAVLDGGLSVSAADAIRGGLGEPSEAAPESVLSVAAERLCAEAAGLDPDRLQRRARELRDELDEEGIADRETERRQQRSLRLSRLPDGMTRATWLMDPETGAYVAALFDRATSPRRGGPRFVGEDDRAVAEAVVADDRTTEQLASDVFLELLRQGADADSSQLLGSGGPVVTLHVTRGGPGYLEGQPDPVSPATVERMTCAGGVTEVTFDEHGQPLDVGREQRLFTRRQRRALAARDGGCVAPGCDRPPSWTEAHHIQHWARDGGRTDVADGVLLCRHHHLLFHNNGWEIERDHRGRWLIPPRDVDPEQTRVLLVSKNPLRRARAA